jgi:hypothetical protein
MNFIFESISMGIPTVINSPNASFWIVSLNQILAIGESGVWLKIVTEL